MFYKFTFYYLSFFHMYGFKTSLTHALNQMNPGNLQVSIHYDRWIDQLRISFLTPHLYKDRLAKLVFFFRIM